MILSDTMINLSDDVAITPYDPDQLNPASYDLRLSDQLMIGSYMGDLSSLQGPIDLADLPDDYLTHHQIPEGRSYTLYPGEFILGCTSERVTLPGSLAARVEGKSSLARVGLAVHVTGGFIDPGFDGQITLEIVNLFNRPLCLHPGMRIAQIAFMMIMGNVGKSYAVTGHYQGQTGPTLSRYRMDAQ